MPQIRPIYLSQLALPVIALMLWLMPPAAKAAAYPPFPAHSPWFNVSQPLTVAELKGRVVLLDFFTPGCINCIHMIPVLQKLKTEFGDDLLVVGVTSPKFSASKRADNMTPFLRRFHIDEPVFIDADMTWWQHYGVFAWPTILLLDPQGKVIHRFVGERSAAQMAPPISDLIAAAKTAGTLTHPALPLKPLAHDSHFFVLPTKIAVAGDWVAVSDTGHNRVDLFTKNGTLITRIGSGQAGFVDGNAASAEFNRPQGLAFIGNALYVADTDNQRIRKIDLATQTVSTVAGNGTRGDGATAANTPLSTALNSPWGLASNQGALSIAMAGDHQIWQLNPATNTLSVYAGTGEEGLRNGERLTAQFAQSSGLAFDAHNLYVADAESSSLRQINLDTGLVITLVGKGLFDFGDKDGAATQALLQHPQGLAYLNGALYIADTFNNAIRKLDLGSLQVSTVLRHLAQPNGLAVLNDHTLLIADTNQDRVVELNLTNGTTTPWPPNEPLVTP
jgi:thiol-disulfide isomerase/thioredoxin/DNA-binding beta-propeller fold protein YncE